MPLERKDENYRKRYLARAGALLAWIGTGALTITNADVGLMFTVIYCATVVAGFIAVALFHIRYRCPQCGARLPRIQIDASAGDEHGFYCRRCDILRKTGIHLDSS